MDQRSRTKSGQNPPLKRWVDPQLKQVHLKPDEAVLGNCKMFSFSGPGSSNCRTPFKCSLIGS